METKEAFEKAIAVAEEEHLKGTDPVYVPLVRSWYETIHVHVGELTRERDEFRRLYHQAVETVQRKYRGHEPLENVLKKAAERDELKAKYELQLAAWEKDGQKIGEIASRYLTLRARIESSQKIWIHALTGAISLVPPTGNNWVHVHAVPVEQE